MMMRKAVALLRVSGCVLTTVFLMSPVYAAPPISSLEKVYHAETMTLDNGMQVVVIPNHRAPVVSHMVWYKVGAADEPQGDGVSGAAHFLEHLMFKGSGALKPGQFSKIIKSIGGEDNAFTSWDYTAFFQSVAKDQLSTVMALEADRMINITLPPKEIESEREVIIEERRMRTDNDPQSLFSEQMRAALFSATPYEVPIIGWRDEMPKLKREHVAQYYKTWYAPNNAILVVSGDVTLAEVAPLAKKFYGVIPMRPVPEHVRPLTPDFPAPVTLTFESAELRQPVFLRAWRAPGFMMDKSQAYALDVLMETLSGGASTELYQSLVVQDKKASDIDLSYEGDSRGEGSVWLSATPAPGVSLETLKAAIEAKLAQLIKDGVSEADIEKAKTRLIDSETYARDSVMGPAMVVGQALSYGMTLDDVETRPQYIAAVQASDVMGVLKTYLDPVSPAHLPVTGSMIPKEKKVQK
jgi:zinc protease